MVLVVVQTAAAHKPVAAVPAPGVSKTQLGTSASPEARLPTLPQEDAPQLQASVLAAQPGASLASALKHRPPELPQGAGFGSGLEDPAAKTPLAAPGVPCGSTAAFSFSVSFAGPSPLPPATGGSGAGAGAGGLPSFVEGPGGRDDDDDAVLLALGITGPNGRGGPTRRYRTRTSNLDPLGAGTFKGFLASSNFNHWPSTLMMLM